MKKLEYVPPQSEEYAKLVEDLARSLNHAAHQLLDFVTWIRNEQERQNPVEKSRYMN